MTDRRFYQRPASEAEADYALESDRQKLDTLCGPRKMVKVRKYADGTMRARIAGRHRTVKAFAVVDGAFDDDPSFNSLVVDVVFKTPMLADALEKYGRK